MDPRRKKWWHPVYSGHRWVTHEGRKRPDREPYHWTIVDVWESECPVSAITQRSFDLVQIVNAMQGAQLSTGSTVGADEMPGYLLDAIRACQRESNASDRAMDEAQNS